MPSDEQPVEWGEKRDPASPCGPSEKDKSHEKRCQRMGQGEGDEGKRVVSFEPTVCFLKNSRAGMRPNPKVRLRTKHVPRTVATPERRDTLTDFEF